MNTNFRPNLVSIPRRLNGYDVVNIQLNVIPETGNYDGVLRGQNGKNFVTAVFSESIEQGGWFSAHYFDGDNRGNNADESLKDYLKRLEE